MGYIKGIVTKVHVGDPEEPKQAGWSKSARFGLQIDGKWWNGYTNQDKQSGAFPVKDKDYAVIADGMEVEFMTTTNTKDGKTYENMDKKTLKVTSAQSVPQPAPTPQSTQQPTPTEEVATNASNGITEAILKQRGADGLAAISALIKFGGKALPDDLEDKLKRMSEFYIKTL